MDFSIRLISVLAIAAGAFLYFYAGKTGEEKKRPKIFAPAGIVLITAGLVLPLFFRPAAARSLVTWQEYTLESLENASSEGKPVLLYFYADWCAPCHQMHETTFSDKRVSDALDRFVRVKADLTDTHSAESETLIERFNLDGVPVLIFIGPDGVEIANARLFGYVSARELLQIINSPELNNRINGQ